MREIQLRVDAQLAARDPLDLVLAQIREALRPLRHRAASDVERVGQARWPPKKVDGFGLGHGPTRS